MSVAATNRAAHAPVAPRSSLREWWVPAMLVVLSLVPAAGGVSRLAQLGGPVTAENARFAADPLPIVLHVLAVIPFSIVGAFQFAAGFRRRHRGWHRAAGRVLVVCGLLSALTGLWMTLRYPWAPFDGRAVYIERLVFGMGMLVSLLLAVAAIRRRDFITHGEWMTRAYAIGLGAGTQVLTHLPWFLLVGAGPAEFPTGTPRAVMMGAGWAINALVAEWVIRRRGARQVLRRAPVPTALQGL